MTESPASERPARVFLIIPAYNEALRLPAVLAEIEQAGLGCEIVVIDDGSQDETAASARQAGARVIRHPFNLGYGAALQTGYKWARAHGADILLQMDGDGQHQGVELVGLLDMVRRDECDLAIGSRFLEPGPDGYQMGSVRSLGRKVFRWMARLGGLDITDPTSGLQAMNRRVLDLYVSDLYPTDFPDVDVLLYVHRRGLRIRERAVEMTESGRPSTLHSGWAPIYYCYRMLLALWAVSGEPRVGRG